MAAPAIELRDAALLPKQEFMVRVESRHKIRLACCKALGVSIIAATNYILVNPSHKFPNTVCIMSYFPCSVK